MTPARSIPGPAFLLVGLFACLTAPSRAHAVPCGPGRTPAWTIGGVEADGRFGTIAPAGDVNHDGYADVIVGCYNCSDGETNEGVVRLYLGGPGGLSASAAWSAGANQAGAKLADKLSGAGDVNGDGYDDVIAGAAFYDSTRTDEGAAFLWLGGPTGLSPAPVWVTYGRQSGAQYGGCAQGAGDVNGDGYDDVIVGAWLYSAPGHPFCGRASLYLGSATGLASTPAWIGENDSDNSVYGYFVVGIGDVNRDGFGDVAVGARRFSGNGLTREGRVYVYYGSPTGLPVVANWIHDGGQGGGEFGASLAPAGDVNGDGYGDLIVGAFRFDHPEANEGTAYVFIGGPLGLADSAAWMVEGDQADGLYGYHVDTAGDANGDGFDDVVVSASQYDEAGLVDAGRMALYLGSNHGLATVPAFIQHGDQTAGGLGNAVRGVGDVNDDGLGDFGSGALYHDEGGLVDAGRAYVFLGCRGGPTDAPIATSGDVRLELVGGNPFSRRATFVLQLARAASAQLDVLDAGGRRVASLWDGPLAEGRSTFAWDAHSGGGPSAPAGLYFIRCRADGAARTMRVVCLH